jgi:hypothetical protein
MHISEFTATWHMRGHDESFRLLDRIISYTFVCSTDRSYTYTQLAIPRHRNVSIKSTSATLQSTHRQVASVWIQTYHGTVFPTHPPTHPLTHPHCVIK